jgi:hypothetical protein
MRGAQEGPNSNIVPNSPHGGIIRSDDPRGRSCIPATCHSSPRHAAFAASSEGASPLPRMPCCSASPAAPFSTQNPPASRLRRGVVLIDAADDGALVEDEPIVAGR